MENKHRGVMQFVPLVIGVAICLLVLVTVAMPIINTSVYTAAGTIAWTGTTATILAQLLPLTAVLGLAIIAAVLMGVFQQ